MTSEFTTNGAQYVPEPAIMNGKKGNIWTMWKKVDGAWVKAGKMFAATTATQSDIIAAGLFFHPCLSKNLSVIGVLERLWKAVVSLVKNIKSRSDISP